MPSTAMTSKRFFCRTSAWSAASKSCQFVNIPPSQCTRAVDTARFCQIPRTIIWNSLPVWCSNMASQFLHDSCRIKSGMRYIASKIFPEIRWAYCPVFDWRTTKSAYISEFAMRHLLHVFYLHNAFLQA